jgi:predicted MFS family arabinose efflux permease
MLNVKQSIIVLLALQFVITLTMASVVSLAPVLAAFFQVPVAQVFLLNLGFMLSGVFSPIFGYFADKHGVKRMLVLGAFTFSVGTLLTAYATNMYVYVFTRMLIGIGHNVFFGLVAAYSARLVTPKEVVKLSGYYKIAFAGGIFSAPVIAGFLVLTYSFEVLYLILAAFGFVFAFLMTRMPKVARAPGTPMSLDDFGTLLKTPYVRWTLIMCFLITVAPNSIFSFFGIHLNSLGYDQPYIQFAYLILGFGSFVSGFVILFLNRRFSFNRFLTYGIYGVLVSLALFVTNLPILLLPTVFIFALSFDLVIGVLYPFIAQLPSDKSASFITLSSLTMAITAIIVTIINPITFSIGGYQLMAAIALVASILGYLSLLKTQKLVKLARAAQAINT